MPVAKALQQRLGNLEVSRLPLDRLFPVSGEMFPAVDAVPATDEGIAAVLIPALVMMPPVVEADGAQGWRVVANAGTVAVLRACVPPGEWRSVRIPCLHWDENAPVPLEPSQVMAAFDVMLGRATDAAERETRRLLRRKAGIRFRHPSLDAMAYLAADRHR